jgi:hypothetical protein
MTFPARRHPKPEQKRTGRRVVSGTHSHSCAKDVSRWAVHSVRGLRWRSSAVSPLGPGRARSARPTRCYSNPLPDFAAAGITSPIASPSACVSLSVPMIRRSGIGASRMSVGVRKI